MAFIYKGAGGSDRNPLPYAELARLYKGASSGDPIAGIAFDSLAKSEQLLAESIFKAYNGEAKPLPEVVFKDGKPVVKKRKVKKPKVVDPFAPIPIPDIKPNRLVVKSEKALRNDILDAELNSPDPFIRERARAWKNGEI